MIGAGGEPVTPNPYVEFLPVERRAAARLEPEETWWPWQGHRVHLARACRPDSPVRVLVVHGAGGHSGALWPMAALLADHGLDLAAVDLPLYGRTTSPDPPGVRYEDWVRLLVDLVAAEHDDRPLLLLGASIGGMLAYEVAARSPHVASVIATCLLDPRSQRARARMTRFGPLGVLCGPLSVLVRGPLARAMIPMNRIADLSKMSRDPGLAARCAADPAGGGSLVPLGFLASYLRYRHAPPGSMTTPVTLAHPELDAWTPVDLSLRVLRRIPSANEVVMLRGCGHFPVEEPGITDLVSAVLERAEHARRNR